MNGTFWPASRRPVRNEVAALEFFERFVDRDGAFVVVRRRAAVAGEVLEARDDAAVGQRVRDNPGHRGAKFRVCAERAGADRGIFAGRYVGDRRKIEIEAERVQVARDLLPGGIGRGRVGGLADGLHRADAGVDGKAARLQAGDVPPSSSTPRKSGILE